MKQRLFPPSSLWMFTAARRRPGKRFPAAPGLRSVAFVSRATRSVVAVFLLGLFAVPAVGAAEAPRDTAVRFHRVFAPENRMEDWPTRGEKYLPMEAAEFDRLVESLQPRPAAEKAAAVPLATLASAKYEAKLIDGRLVGKATLEMVLTGSSPAMATLGLCNFAIADAWWKSSGGLPLSDARRAVLGSAEDGRLALVVERSGRLDFHWSLAAERDSPVSREFALEFPVAPTSQLTLDLPKEFSVDAGAGAVVSRQSPLGESLRRWVIEFGGRSRCDLALTASDHGQPRPPVALVHESSVYDCSLRGVELSSQWKIAVHGEPLREMTFALDPELQLISAHVGEVPIPWSASPQPDGSATRLHLKFPEPIRDAERIVRLIAIGHPVLGRSWRLPRLQPEDVFWEEGNIALLVPEPLLVNRIVASGCHQTGADFLSAPRHGKSFYFQCFDPRPTIEVVLERQSSRCGVRGGATIEIGDDLAAAELRVEFRVEQEVRSRIVADVAPQWTVSAVQSLSGGQVMDWSVDPQPDGMRRLTIRLAEVLRPQRPLCLQINALRTIVPGGKLVGDDFWPLEFRGIAESKRITALRPALAYALKIVGDERVKRLTADDLTPEDLALLADRKWDILFECNVRSSRMEVSPVAQAAAYAAAIHMEVILGETTVQERGVFQCVPQSGKVNRVLVQLSPRRNTVPRWTMDNRADNLMSARRLPSLEAGASGETWELTLRRSQADPFEIVAERDYPVPASPLDVTLASLPEAVQQRGVLVLRGLGQMPWQIENRRLKAFLPDPVAPDRVQKSYGSYRYDPCRDLGGANGAAIRATQLRRPWAAWVWQSKVESWYSPNGPARHCAVFRVHTPGKDRLRFDLPASLDREDMLGVYVNDEPAPWHLVTGEEDHFLVVRIPVDHKSPRVAIEWITREAQFGVLGDCTLVPPKPEAPLLACHWTVWLPPGYRCHSRWLQAVSSTDASGRTSWRAGMNPNRPLSIGYARAPTMQLLGVLVFLLVVALGGWRVRRPLPAATAVEASLPEFAAAPRASQSVPVLGHTVLALILVAAGTAAVALPDAQAAIPLGAAAGVLFSLGWRIRQDRAFRRANAASSSRAGGTFSVPSPNSSSVVTMFLPLLAAALSLIAGSVQAGSSRDAAEDSAESGYRVFIPIDAQRNPSGDKVYLPEPFYRQLLRHASSSVEKPSPWLITEAVYQGVLIREPASERLTVEAVHVNYVLRIVDRAARVCLPIGDEGKNAPPANILVDGRPLHPLWDPKTSTMSFRVPEPGSYRLEFTLQPRVEHRDGFGRFDLRVPRAANARFELTLPPNYPTPIEVPSARGQISWSPSQSRCVTQLGPSDRLAVRWSDGDAPKPVPPLEADQLMWVKIRPGSVTLDLKVKLDAGERPLQQLQLLLDARLRILPLSGENAPTVHAGPEVGQNRLLTFRWPRPVASRETLDATFLMSGTSGTGKVRLPLIRLQDAKPKRHWLAVSIDPALNGEQDKNGQLETIPVSDFIQEWGDSHAKPLAAYHIAKEDAVFTLATRPQEAIASADQTLTMSFDDDHLEMLLSARISVVRGYFFQHFITAPPALKVRHVSVLEHDVERCDRWSQDKDGSLTVFLNAPASGQHRLVVRGDIPLRMGESQFLPFLRIEKCQLDVAATRIYRRPAVLLSMEGGPPSGSTNGGADEADEPEFGRLVRCLWWQQSRPPAVRVRVEPNRPDLRAQQAVWLQTDGKSWTAGTDCNISIRGGVCDEFNVQAPAPWSGPFEVNQPGTLRIRDIPGKGRCLAFRPREAVAGEDYQFRITGSLDLSLGRGPSAPNLCLMGVNSLERWFVLPDRTDTLVQHWQVQGLRAASLPAALDESRFPRTAVYEAFREPVSAMLHSSTSPTPSGFVRLTDVTLAQQMDGSWYGAAAMDLEPGGAYECLLRLPKTFDLLHASIEGMPTAVARQEDRLWRLTLASQHLPQRVNVVFRRDAIRPNDKNILDFIPPKIDQWPVRQTLWSVLPAPSHTVVHAQGSSPIGPARFKLLQLENVMATIESAVAASADENEQSLRWTLPWSRRLLGVCADLKRELGDSKGHGDREAVGSEAKNLQHQIVGLAQKLGVREAMADLVVEKKIADGAGRARVPPQNAGDPADNLADALRNTVPRLRNIAQYVSTDEEARLTVECREMPLLHTSQWFAIGTALIGLISIAIVSMARDMFSPRQKV